MINVNKLEYSKYMFENIIEWSAYCTTQGPQGKL